MGDRRTIVVVGATGQQGGAVADAILADPQGGFAVRAVTRDPKKEKAQKLAARGAEVVAANVDDPASLKRAFDGAYGAYCMTSYWEGGSAQAETARARNMAEAARAAGLRHVVWATLEDTRKLMPAADRRMPILQGGYRVPNYDGKAEGNAHFAGIPTTFLVLSWFWDNLCVPGYGPMKGPDGTYAWALPLGQAKLAGIGVEDVGRCAYATLKAGPEKTARPIGIVAEALTIPQMCDVLSRKLGMGPIRYDDVPADAYRGFGFPGADVVGNMYQFYRDFEREVLAARSVDATRALHPHLASFEQWVDRNRARIVR